MGIEQLESGKLVTFGITPTQPETGYGYLELSSKDDGDFSAKSVLRFIEKPNKRNAERLLQSGNYFWNAGIFLFKAQDMIRAFERFEPVTLSLVKAAVSDARADLGFLRLKAEVWSKLDSKSIDYAIMEKADNLVAVPYTSKWSDLGGWNAVWSEAERDENGNALSDAAHAISCENCCCCS